MIPKSWYKQHDGSLSAKAVPVYITGKIKAMLCILANTVVIIYKVFSTDKIFQKYQKKEHIYKTESISDVLSQK